MWRRCRSNPIGKENTVAARGNHKNHDIIVIGASAGGVEALITVVSSLPKDLPASVFIVLHVSAQSPSILPEILNRRARMEARHPKDGDKIRMGRIYVAPSDHHLTVEEGYVRVVRGPRENRYRPAIDPLFRSAARVYGPRVVGVILTGALDDGTAGMVAIKSRGGISIVQDPEEALYPGMPRSAIENAKIDYIMSLDEIGPLLVRLAHEPAEEEGAYPVPEKMDYEAKVAEMAATSTEEMNRLGKPAVYACPECHGTLWELRDGNMTRFRCRVGHAYSPESLMAEHSESVESALWAALRALEEKASLARQMATSAHYRNHDSIANRFARNAETIDRHAGTLREVLQSNRTMVENANGELEESA
jgi:two-component system, chemotaxis family, protein-glutamate methylesterase/glutaminase